jgi:hypothetical protein
MDHSSGTKILETNHLLNLGSSLVLILILNLYDIGSTVVRMIFSSYFTQPPFLT